MSGSVFEKEYAEWQDLVSEDKHIALGMHVRVTVDGIVGLLVLLSTPVSCSVSKQNQEAYESKEPKTDPHWLYFDVYWYPGLALLDFLGISRSVNAARGMQNRLGDMLNDHFGSKGMHNWRDKYCHCTRGYFMESLRYLLRKEFSAYNWLEFTLGYSREASCVKTASKVMGAQGPPDFRKRLSIGNKIRKTPDHSSTYIK